MKCPMSNYVMERESGEDEVLLNDCFKEDCAWWEPNDGQCSVVVLAQFAAGMGQNIRDIKDKLLERRE